MKPKSILITAPNWVGDAVMATPAFRCVRENFPKAKISLLLRPFIKGVLEGAPWFDEWIEFDPKEKHKQPGRYLALIRRLRKEQFDMGFILPNSFSSALVAWLAGIKQRVGYIRDARSWLLTQGVKRFKEKGRFRPAYMADYYLRLCASAGCEISSGELELFASKESMEKINKLFSKYKISKNKPVFLINPGASFGSSKSWTTAGFARTAELLHEEFDCHVLLASAPQEKDTASKIEKAARGKVLNLTHERITLDLLKALIKKVSTLITVDSGPRHIAVAFKKPVVVLMGPTDPRYTHTSQEIGRVIRERVDCAPCHLKECPKDHRCMEWIKPEKVVEACRELMVEVAAT
ncbi:MAG TPA: lipopolysaccharide heptosyltransferase II [Candidatus Hypogeohydataceae bacterium YC41]